MGAGIHYCFFEQSLLSIHYLLDNPNERENCIQDAKDISGEVGEIFLKTLTMTALVDNELAPQEAIFFKLAIKYFGIPNETLADLNDLISAPNVKVSVKKLKNELLRVDSSYYEMIIRVIAAVSKVDNIVRKEEDILLTVFSNYFSLEASKFINIGKINIFVEGKEIRPIVANRDIEVIILIVQENPGCTVKFLLNELRGKGISISKYQLNSHYKESVQMQKKLEKNSDGTWSLRAKLKK